MAVAAAVAMPPPPSPVKVLEGELLAINAQYAAYIVQAASLFGTPDQFLANLQAISPDFVREYRIKEHDTYLANYARFYQLVEANGNSDEIKARIMNMSSLVWYITTVKRLHDAAAQGTPEATAVVARQLHERYKQANQRAPVPAAVRNARERIPPKAGVAYVGPKFPGEGRGVAAAAAAVQQQPPPPPPPPPQKQQQLFSPLTRELAALPFAELTPMYVEESRIKVGKMLGQGGFKRVYRVELDGATYAWATYLPRQVQPDKLTGLLPPAYKDMWDEARLLIACRNPYIVNVVGWSVNVRREFSFLMELMEGGDMFAWANKNGWYAKSELGAVIARVVTAVATFNEQVRYVHRDLKMENLFVDAKGGNIKIGDLGMAEHVSGPDGRPPYSAKIDYEKGLGTRGFIPPEVPQHQGEHIVTVKWDSYSLAGILSQLTAKAAVYRLSEAELDALARQVFNDQQLSVWRRLRAADPARRIYSWQAPMDESFWRIVK